MSYCYILFSENLNKFYIGETDDIDTRLNQHNQAFFKGSFSTQTDDWIIFLVIACNSRSQARRIERHIKNMKSSKYIYNLKKYPEMVDKLLARFS